MTGQPNVELWKARVNRGWSRRELARRAKTTSKTIGEVEKGHIPGAELQHRIARCFGPEKVSTDFFPIEEQVYA